MPYNHATVGKPNEDLSTFWTTPAQCCCRCWFVVVSNFGCFQPDGSISEKTSLR